MSDKANEENDIDLTDLERRMEGALSALRTEFLSLRTGRAAASMLDPISVEAYGQRTPLNQVGTINVPESRMVTINIWDKTMVGAVEKAIRESGLGINPVVDGTIIRLPIPQLSEERRQELAKVAAQYAERARVAVRNLRREGMEFIKQANTDTENKMGDDDAKLWSEDVQALTDQYTETIGTLLEKKQEEIMQV